MAAWLTMGAANCAAVFSALLLRSEGGIALTLLAFALNALTLFLTGACARAPPTAGWPAPAAVGAAGVLHPACMSSGGCASPRPHPPPTPPLPPPPSLQAFERMLVAGCLPVAAAVQTWGLVSGVGMSAATFFLAALLCGLYALFALPLPSSFHLGKSRASMGERALASRPQGWWWARVLLEPPQAARARVCACLRRRCSSPETSLCAWSASAPAASYSCGCCRRQPPQGAHAAGLDRRLCRVPAGRGPAGGGVCGHPLGRAVADGALLERAAAGHRAARLCHQPARCVWVAY